MEDYLPRPAAKLPDDLRLWATQLRAGMTDAEALLWAMLRNRRLAGAKFRRQHPVGRFILDFYCADKKLAVELDGGQHADAVDYDQRRDAWLGAQGIHVVRFWNNQVLMETEAVMEVIYGLVTAGVLADSLIPDPSPACGRREQD